MTPDTDGMMADLGPSALPKVVDGCPRVVFPTCYRVDDEMLPTINKYRACNQHHVCGTVHTFHMHRQIIWFKGGGRSQSV